MALSSWYNGGNSGWFEERTDTNGGMAYSVYIPPNVNSNTQIQVFSCNPHDYGPTWLSYVKQKQAEHPDNIYVVIPSIQDGVNKAPNFFADRILDITNEYNIPTTNINMYNWSNGNKGSSAVASALNSKGYTIGKYVSVFGIYEGAYIEGFIDNFETGKSSNFPYIFIDDGSTGSSYLKNNCNDYIVIKINNPDSHSFYVADKKFNLIDFFLAGEDFKNNVTITRYVNGEKQTLTYDEFIELMNTSSIEGLYEKNSELDAFAQYFNGGPGDTLGSNLAYVSNAMNSMKGKITEHQDINYTKESDNEANIIGTMYAATNYYGAVTNLLYGNMKTEADAVYNIANAIYKMDGCASQIAESSLTDNMSNLYNTSGLSNEVAALEKASADLYDTAKSSVLAGGRYDALESIFSNKAESGKVGKVSISSLESAINAIVPSLNNEVETANSLKSDVNDFMSNIGSSNILQGGVWDNVKKNMQNYSNLLDANIKSANVIDEALKTAMGLVTDYIQGAEGSISAVDALSDYGGLATAGELDDTKLPELTQALDEMQAKIDETDAKVKELEASRHMVDDGYTDPETGEFVKTGEHQEPSEEEIQPYRDQLEKYKQIKQTLDEYREVLEGLAPVVQAAQDIIEQAIGLVKNMYENPVQDTDGNITFNTNFELDLSPYADYMDETKDYKQLINDYYDKLNPKATVEDVLALDAKDTEPVGGKDDPDKDNYNPGGGGNPGDSGDTGGTPSAPDTPTLPTDPVTEPRTEVSTETKTESITENPTETKTEIQTEGITEMPTESVTETPTEIQTEASTEKPGHETKPSSGGGTSKKPKNPNVETKPTEPVIVDTQEELPTEASYVEPSIEDDYFENEIPTEINVEEIVPEDEIANAQRKGNGMKTLGIAAGIGLAVGAAALGAHTVMKSKEEDEDDYDDYGYEK